MAGRKRKGDQPSMRSVVKQILDKKPEARAKEIVEIAKLEHGVDIPERTAGVYRYSILNPTKAGKKKRRNKLQPTEPVAPSRGISSAEGYEDLFRAAEKMGWKRLRAVVERITAAPN